MKEILGCQLSGQWFQRMASVKESDRKSRVRGLVTWSGEGLSFWRDLMNKSFKVGQEGGQGGGEE